ncbi:peptide deformylase [Bifidobacterium aemilianum]|uniref:Peptide deformylase n=1 Tax=Bifidobacterium aemilianum TaxID=2493120 RepID=A0A366K6T9_9BIFI|nr:peptide deformylase [Bifidobacterium aemilianum]RBP97374.1 peptide deformylase [Bifidobacterium aemilianum]
MEQAIMRSRAFLSRVSKEAKPEDVQVAQDLKDTLVAHEENCAGLAANMIGESKRIIVFKDELTGGLATMFNPSIIEKDGPYETEEGCLSLDGARHTTRYQRIRVTYQDHRFRERTATFIGWTAQIIQHEIDHCMGVLI